MHHLPYLAALLTRHKWNDAKDQTHRPRIHLWSTGSIYSTWALGFHIGYILWEHWQILDQNHQSIIWWRFWGTFRRCRIPPRNVLGYLCLTIQRWGIHYLYLLYLYVRTLFLLKEKHPKSHFQDLLRWFRMAWLPFSHTERFSLAICGYRTKSYPKDYSCLTSSSNPNHYHYVELILHGLFYHHKHGVYLRSWLRIICLLEWPYYSHVSACRADSWSTSLLFTTAASQISCCLL